MNTFAMKINFNMKKSFPSILLGIFVAGTMLILQSCQVQSCGINKKMFLDRYHAFVEKADGLELEISHEKWEEYDETFEHFVEVCYEKYEDELTEKEKKRFWIGSLKYYATRYGDGLLHELEKDDGEYAEKVKQNLEEIFEETGQKVEDFFNKNEAEIEALVDQISNDIEAWAEKLQEIFEE